MINFKCGNAQILYTGIREDDDWFWGIPILQTHYDEIIPYKILEDLEYDEELNETLKYYSKLLFDIDEKPQFHIMLINII